MAIQYSGNAQVSTFVPTDKQDIINDVETALLAAGWTTVSGHGTTSLLMQSATTPQGYNFRVLAQDNSGTCVTFSLQSTDGSLIGGNSTTVGGGFLNPTTSSPTFQVVANKYQAFIYVYPYTTANRSFVAFGVPWVPSWVTPSVTQLAWMEGDAHNDTDTTQWYTLRRALCVGSNSLAGMQVMVNGTLWTGAGANGAVGGIGLAALGNYNGTSYAGYPESGYRWYGLSAILFDALISWSPSSLTTEGFFFGQLWDACVSTASYAADGAATFDGHNWTTVTSNSFATVAAFAGTLLLATS